jgi:nitrite reductase/ring-hydroxylating ferredoxin subunit
MAVELDLERVVCRLSELAGGARAFTIGGGNWPLRMFIVRVADTVHGYLNRCPHAGHPLILCSSHGALFEKSSGYCVAGPCAGRALTPVPLEVKGGFVLLADGVDIEALADTAP